MKYDICMRRECKNCFKKLECFKEEEKEDKFKESKNKGFENNSTQSQNKARKR